MSSIAIFDDVFEIINVVCWALSYYTLIYGMAKSKTGDGFSLDYQLLAISSGIYYAVYSVSLVTHGDLSFINLTDAIFAIHGVVAGFAVLGLTLCLPRKLNNFDPSVMIILSIGVSMILMFYLTGVRTEIASFDDFWLFIGISKVILTTVKYTYQVLLSYDRKSTFGFAAGNVYLDLAGSLASVVQLYIQYAVEGNHEINIAKVLLTIVSLVMDLILLYQHHILYKGRVPANDSFSAPLVAVD